jgi:hypothetical protein
VKWTGERIGDSILLKIEDADVQVETLLDASDACEVGTMLLRLGTGSAGDTLDEEITS